MTRFEHSIDVNVPLRVAYNQWTQFEDFPRFMEGVRAVHQKTDTLLHWVAEIAGRTEEWDAEISEQKPDSRIAWHSTSGAKHAGIVTFHYIAENTTRIILQINFEPEGVFENIGAALGIVQRRIVRDLEAFKTFIENRGYETGAWRGKVSPYEDAQSPWGTRYNQSANRDEPEGRDGSTGAPSFASMEVRPGEAQERGERNELGENSFSSSENGGPAPKEAAVENWNASPTPSPGPSPVNDLGNSDVAPGSEPAHGFGAVEKEPQADERDNVKSR